MATAAPYRPERDFRYIEINRRLRELRLERELASLQQQTKGYEETYGLDNLHLTVAKAYLAKLLANVRVVRWLAQSKPEYLSEFQAIAELTSLPTEAPSAVE